MPEDTVCHLYPFFKLKDVDAFKKIWKDAYAATEAAAGEEKSHQYAFAFHTAEDGSITASCRESYGDAEGVLTHLKNVDGPLNAVLNGPADLASLELHGPAAEVAKLQEALGPLGCLFYETGWGFRNATPKA